MGKARNYFNIFITFVVSGIWHGANWTFVIWGTLHGLYITIQKYFKFDRKRFKKFTALKAGLILINFILVLLAWVFFRANSTSDAFSVLGKIFTDPGIPFKESVTTYIYGLFGLAILIIKEIHDEYFPERYRFFESEKPMVSAFASSMLLIIILSIGVFDGGQFIYFQF